MNGPSNGFNIVRSERDDRETAILGHVDGVLLPQLLHLLLVQTSVAEHAYLSSDVGPVTGRPWIEEERGGERWREGEGEGERENVHVIIMTYSR